MTAVRWTLVAGLASALVAPPALAQQGSSVSLIHTVTVTVPPRVQVQLGATQATQSVSFSSGSSDAMAISVSATRSWSLTIASRKESSFLQWSTDQRADFARLNRLPAKIASGKPAQMAATSTLFFRNSVQPKGSGADEEGEAVVLTMVAP